MVNSNSYFYCKGYTMTHFLNKLFLIGLMSLFVHDAHALRITRIYRPGYGYSQWSLEEALIGTAVFLGLCGVVGYLASESEEQIRERERQKLAMLAAMTPAQRELYYQQERLKIEQKKADALQQQATAAWLNAFCAPAYQPTIVEEIYY